jgi:hypothetical protein
MYHPQTHLQSFNLTEVVQTSNGERLLTLHFLVFKFTAAVDRGSSGLNLSLKLRVILNLNLPVRDIVGIALPVPVPVPVAVAVAVAVTPSRIHTHRSIFK